MRGFSTNFEKLLIFSLFFLNFGLFAQTNAEQLLELTELDVILLDKCTNDVLIGVAKNHCGIESMTSEFSISLMQCVNKFEKDQLTPILNNFDNVFLNQPTLQKFHPIFSQWRHSLNELGEQKSMGVFKKYSSAEIAKLLLGGISAFARIVLAPLLKLYYDGFAQKGNFMQEQIKRIEMKHNAYKHIERIMAMIAKSKSSFTNLIKQIFDPTSQYHFEFHIQIDAELFLKQLRGFMIGLNKICGVPELKEFVEHKFGQMVDREVAKESVEIFASKCSISKIGNASNQILFGVYENAFLGVENNGLGTAAAWFHELLQCLMNWPGDKKTEVPTLLIYGTSIVANALGSKLLGQTETPKREIRAMQKWMSAISGRLYGEVKRKVTGNLEKLLEKAFKLMRSPVGNKDIPLPLAVTV